MGYYVDATASEWVVPETAEVLAAIKEMPVKMKRIQRGGSWSKGGMKESWFSWVNDNDILNAESVEEVFGHFGFETREIDARFTAHDGPAFEISGYSSKLGQEELLLAVVAPFCAEGSYVEWRGEDGEEWMFQVKNKKMVRCEATKTWDDGVEYKYYHHGSYEDANGDLKFYNAAIDVYGDIDAQVDEVVNSVRV